MHQGTRVVLDERLNAEGSLIILYTSLEHADFLSEADQLGLQAIFSATPYTEPRSLGLAVQIQHSSDGRNWLNMNTNPELAQVIALAPGESQWSLIGGESWPTRPRLRFVRLAISVQTLHVSPPASRLQVFVTARSRLWSPDDAERAVAPPHLAPVTRREAMGRLLGMRQSTFEEVEMHMRAVQPGDHPSQMINRLSPGARADLERVTSSLRNLPPEQKHAALTFTSALANLLMLPPERSETPEPTSAPSTRLA